MGEAARVQIAKKSIAQADVVIVPCFEKEAPASIGLPKRIRTACAQAVDRQGWRATLGQPAMTRSSAPGRPFVAVIGMGGREKYGTFRLGEWLQRAVSRLQIEGFRRPVLRLPEKASPHSAENALFVQRVLAGELYSYDAYTSGERRTPLRLVGILPPPEEEAIYRAVAPVSRNIAEGIAWCRRLANTPPNEADPQWMTEQATSLAADFGMEVEVLDQREMESRGMGGILAVGKGSTKPPRMVRLSWGEGDGSLALVGKGVTFDSGGLSLKPAASMDEMKFDKAGACTVLGIARALAGARIPGRFSCYLAFAENMPGGRSYRPGDIVHCYSGKTVEVLNTDAEGRMMLADALTWAQEDRPEQILDFATLTGACVVALGEAGGGLFSKSDALAGELLSAAESAGERLWRLPLWPEFEKQMQGQHADLRNIGGRWGGASTAAAFLAQFVADRSSWAHLDIAGPAYHGRARKSRFGATGYGVALTMNWILRQSGKL